MTDLASPRFENGKPLRIAGLRERYPMNGDAQKSIPLQWRRFMPHIGKVPGQVGRVAYGLCFDAADGSAFDYVSGVEVSPDSTLPEDLISVDIPAVKYAVFPHNGPASTLSQTCQSIWSKWLPNSGYKSANVAGGLGLFERYGEKFDPQTLTGDIEVWVPVLGDK
jgi:AraC family transcriptional regulator